MADSVPTIKVDAREVLAKYIAIPERVRNRLRQTIPGLTREVADALRAKLAPGALGVSAATGLPLLRTSDHILPAVRAQMMENISGITGRVDIDPSRFPALVTNVIESGARAHVISARNASVLYFFWDRIGRFAAFHSVNHPGFPGTQVMAKTAIEKQPRIRQVIEDAVRQELAH